MPKFDKTGPNGDGPMTGRKMGNCAEKESDEKGMGRGKGRRGKGKGNGRKN